jgi:hypothetical protein
MGWFKHLGLNKLLFGLILYYGLKQVLLFGLFCYYGLKQVLLFGLILLLWVLFELFFYYLFFVIWTFYFWVW